MIGWQGWRIARPNTVSRVEKISPSISKINIENTGLLPATRNYTILTPPGTSFVSEILKGDEYITLQNTSEDNKKVMNINELPGGKWVILKVVSPDVKIKDGPVVYIKPIPMP